MAEKEKPAPRFAIPFESLPDMMTTYWLEMYSQPPTPPALKAEKIPQARLQRCKNPTMDWYRYLYNLIGSPWHWWVRNKMPESELMHILNHPMVDIYVLFVDAVPAGFFELDYRNHPQSVNVAYLGIAPHFIGHSLGPWMLSYAVDYCWLRHGKPQKVTINTCSHDHPAALRFYKSIGFQVVRQEKHAAPPREILQHHVNLHQPLHWGAWTENKKEMGAFTPI